MTNKPLPRRLPAFAIDMLTQHPIALTLPAAGFGMLCRLIFHFIATGCRPIPPEGDDLRGIMRAHRGTWTQHRNSILAVFRELEPQLIAAQAEYIRKREQVLAMGERGRTAQRLHALAKRGARSKSPDQLAPTAPKRAQITTAPPAFPPTDGGWR
jgi:hypothetical protein